MSRIAMILLTAFIVSAAQAEERFITLSSTTSTQDSGLFAYILPIFHGATGIDVHVVAVGTGQALAIGSVVLMSAFGGKADIRWTLRNVR